MRILTKADHDGVSLTLLAAQTGEWTLVVAGEGFRENPFQRWCCRYLASASPDGSVWALRCDCAEFAEDLRQEPSRVYGVERPEVVAVECAGFREDDIVYAMRQACLGAGGPPMRLEFEHGRRDLSGQGPPTKVGELFLDAPGSWLEMPATPGVWGHLVEDNCAYPSPFDLYAHDRLVDAAPPIAPASMACSCAMGCAQRGWCPSFPGMSRGRSPVAARRRLSGG